MTSTDDSRQHPEGIDKTRPLQTTETAAGHRPSTGGRHQHVPPIARVRRNPSQIKIPSDQLTYGILLGLLDGKPYTQQPARRLAEYRQTLPKGRGYVSLALSPRSEESWQQVLTSLELLGDELVDTFLVLLAVALETNGPERITLPLAITAEDILALCLKKKSNGSYAARQRQRVRREAQKRIEQHAYHWWDDYRRQLWLFEPPAHLKALYQSMPREAGAGLKGAISGLKGWLAADCLLSLSLTASVARLTSRLITQHGSKALESFKKLNCYPHCTRHGENYFWNEVVFGLFRLSRLVERTLNLALVSMGNSQILAQSHRLASSMTSFTQTL